MVTPLYRQIAGFSIGTLQLDVSSALCLLRWLFTIEEAGERRDAGCWTADSDASNPIQAPKTERSLFSWAITDAGVAG